MSFAVLCFSHCSAPSRTSLLRALPATVLLLRPLKLPRLRRPLCQVLKRLPSVQSSCYSRRKEGTIELLQSSQHSSARTPRHKPVAVAQFTPVELQRDAKPALVVCDASGSITKTAVLDRQGSCKPLTDLKAGAIIISRQKQKLKRPQYNSQYYVLLLVSTLYTNPMAMH